MSTHEAVVIPAARAPLETRQVETVKPGPGQVRVKNEWTASTPVDLHQADGGLLIKEFPYRIGDGVAGTVVEVGEDVRDLAVGDKVFGFTWRNQAEKAHQTYVTTDTFLLGKIPSGISMEAAVTLPNNAVTAFHTINSELGVTLPWPKPANFSSPAQDAPFLVWGGASSVGQYAIQVLRYYGFRDIITTASKRHHEMLRSLGAAHTVDYNDKDVVAAVRSAAGGKPIAYAIDCVGLLEGTVTPLSKILTDKGAKVAIMLPVIVRDASATEPPVYEMDVEKCVSWAEGVEPIGVRTHFYHTKSELYKEKLQPEIIPELLAQGVVKPNGYRVVEGATMLERAQKAIDALRNREVSGERLVWRVAD